MTNGQLRDLVNSTLASYGSPAVVKHQFTRVLVGMCREGTIERTIEPAPEYTRYRMPEPPRYRLRQVLDSWHVERLHPAIADHWHTIATCTEVEALVCMAALNEHDRKVRGLMQSRKATP